MIRIVLSGRRRLLAVAGLGFAATVATVAVAGAVAPAPAGPAAAPPPLATSAPQTSTAPSPSPSPTTPLPVQTRSATRTTRTSTPEGGATVRIYLTGYGFRDNDCGSGAGGDCTAYGDGRAGGTGTWADPVTLAVGAGGWSPGTRAYLPELRRYVVVEDQCASCGAGYQGLTWVDVWVDGRSLAPTDAEQCMRALTGITTAQLDPPPGLPVDSGTIAAAWGCGV